MLTLVEWHRVRAVENTVKYQQKSPRPVAFLGQFGGGNVGNEVSLEIALNSFRAKAFEVVIIGDEPDGATVLHQAPAINVVLRQPRPEGVTRKRAMPSMPLREVRRWAATLREARHFQALVIPGTGLFDDDSVQFLGLRYDLLCWAIAARAVGRPFVITCLGAEPSLTVSGRLAWRAIAGLADSVSYRDDHSRAALAASGRRTANDEVAADLAFALVDPAGVFVEPSEPGTVVVGVMCAPQWRIVGVDEIYTRYLDRMAALIGDLAGRGYRVRLVLGQPNDQIAADELLARCPGLGDRVQVSSASTFADMLDEMGRAEFAVASRYHHVVAALMLARPVAVVAYRAKHAAAVEPFGLLPLCRQIEDADDDWFESLPSALEAERERMRREGPAVARHLSQLARNELDRAVATVLQPRHRRSLVPRGHGLRSGRR